MGDTKTKIKAVAPVNKRKAGNSRKLGRGRRKCAIYRMEDREKKNKKRKVLRQYKRSGGKDRQAANLLDYRFNMDISGVAV